MKTSEYNTSGNMSGPYTYACRNTAKNECVRICRISERKSTLIIFERHANLKYKYGNRSFWCRGYYVDTAGKNDKKIAEYIKNQLQEDMVHDQMTLKEYTAPFTGK